MPSRPNLSQPEIPPADTTEVLPVSPELAALFARHGVTRDVSQRREGEFTSHEYAAYVGKKLSAASNELLDMYRDGQVTRRLVSRQYFYSFADGRK